MHQFPVRKVFQDSIVIVEVYCNLVHTVTFLEHIDLFAQIDEETVSSDAFYFQILPELLFHIVDTLGLAYLAVTS
jgi:hypothetical protein